MITQLYTVTLEINLAILSYRFKYDIAQKIYSLISMLQRNLVTYSQMDMFNQCSLVVFFQCKVPTNKRMSTYFVIFSQNGTLFHSENIRMIPTHINRDLFHGAVKMLISVI